MQTMYKSQAANGQVELNDSSPIKRHLRKVLFAAAALVVASFAILGQQSYAGEETTLTGIIKSVNPDTGIVYVDVLSKTCPGMKVFKADRPDKLANLIGERITFHLDSTGCRDTAIHTILVSRGIRK